MIINLYQYVAREAIDSFNSFLSKNKNEEIVFFCVGNYKIWYDNFSSRLSEYLKNMTISSFVYGGADFPITANNIIEYMQFIEEKHPSAKIVVIDNCKTTNIYESGTLIAKEVATIPAGLVNSKTFGHYSILLKVCLTEDSNKFLDKQKVVINEIVKNIAI